MNRFILSLAMAIALSAQGQVAMKLLDDVMGDEQVCVTNWGPYITSSIAGINSAITNMATTQYVASVISPLTRRVSCIEGRTNDWNTAFGWGNHAGLYHDIAWVPSIAEVTGLQDALNGKAGTQQVALVAGVAAYAYSPTNPPPAAGGSVESVNGSTGVVTVTLAQAATAGGFAGTETISPALIVISSGGTFTRVSHEGLGVTIPETGFYSTLGDIVGSYGLIIGFSSLSTEWGITGDTLRYTKDSQQADWSFSRPSGNYTVASTADITTHNADTNAHPDKVATTNGTAYSIALTGSPTLNGVQLTTAAITNLQPDAVLGGLNVTNNLVVGGSLCVSNGPVYVRTVTGSGLLITGAGKTGGFDPDNGVLVALAYNAVGNKQFFIGSSEPGSRIGVRIVGNQIMGYNLDTGDTGTVLGNEHGTYVLGTSIGIGGYVGDAGYKMTVAGSASIKGDILATGNANVVSNATVGNLTFAAPRWGDEKFAGLDFAAGGGTAPSRTEVVTGSGIYAMGFDTTDNGDFGLQFQHGVASTNAAFPNFYYEPHLHVTVPTLTAPNTNVTFVIKYYIAPVMGNFNTPSTYVIKTNTVGFTAALEHKLIDFGQVTNNLLSGKDSVVVVGNVERIASATDDYGATEDVFVPSLDFHIPINTVGSTLIHGNGD